MDSNFENAGLDADVASFFDSVSKEKLVRFVEHRVGDPRIVRLIEQLVEGGCLGGRGRHGQ